MTAGPARCPVPDGPTAGRPRAAARFRRATRAGRATPAPRPAGRPGSPGGPSRPGGDRGVTAVEFAGWVPLLLLVALAALQLGLVGYAAIQAGTAARAAARTAAQGEIAQDATADGDAAISDGLDVSFDIEPCGRNGEDGDTATATATAHVTIPTVLPFLGGSGLGQASRTVTMPCD